jgi:hypothetical protein
MSRGHAWLRFEGVFSDVPEEKIVVEDDVVHDDFAWPRVSDEWRVPIRRSALSCRTPRETEALKTHFSLLFSSLLFDLWLVVC